MKSNKRQKILLLSEIFPPVNGGSGRWFWEAYTRMDKDNILVVAHQSEGSAEFDHDSPLKTLRLPLSSSEWGIKSLTGIKFYLAIYRQLVRICKRENITAIHCGRCLPEGFIAYLLHKRLGLPFVCYIHGEDIEAAATSREQRWLVNCALKTATAIICNSHNTSALLNNDWQVKQEKVHVIHPGVDASYFVPQKQDPALRAELGWDDKTVILTVGRLQKRKGQDMMISAMPSLITRYPKLIYAVVGKGSELAHLQKLVEQLQLQDHVQFLQEVDDKTMLQCYQQCNLFILPNRTVEQDIEGFGMVLVEAQACARPVVAGDSGGTKETMLINQTGIIVDCTSPQNIADKLASLLASPQQLQEMGLKGRQHVENSLDWPVLVAQLKHLFATIG